MNTTRTTITVNEIIKGPVSHLADERPSKLRSIHPIIKKVAFKNNCYWLYFSQQGFKPLWPGAGMVRTLAEAFGGDCDAWEGNPVMLVFHPTELLVREEDATAAADESQQQPRKGKPVLSVVPRKSR